MGRGGLQKGGASLEATFNVLLKHYEQKGIFAEQNHPKTLGNGQVVQKHGFDYTIYYNGKMYAIDTKHCNSDVFNLKMNCKMHQVSAMKKVKNHNGEGFFLIYFDYNKKLMKLDVDRVLDAFESGKKTVQFDSKYETKLDILGIL